MLTKKDLTVYIASILTTALETEPDPFPESMAYLAMGGDIEKWNVVRDILSKCEFATFAGHSIALTDKGRTMAKRIESAIV